jgi:hypothetical protein
MAISITGYWHSTAEKPSMLLIWFPNPLRGTVYTKLTAYHDNSLYDRLIYNSIVNLIEIWNYPLFTYNGLVVCEPPKGNITYQLPSAPTILISPSTLSSSSSRSKES